MSEPPRIVRYLRDCYEADNRESVIFNLRHEKIQHLHFLSQGGEFLSYSAWRKNKTACLEAIKAWTNPEAKKRRVTPPFVGCASSPNSQS